jgi:hypothetical protein
MHEGTKENLFLFFCCLDGQMNERKASLVFLVAMHEAMKESLIDFFVLLLQQVHFYCNDAQKNSIHFAN